MKIPKRLLLLALVAFTLTLSGCSYTPARVKSEPLFEIEGERDYRDYRGDDRHYRDRHYRERRYHDRHHRGERGHYDERRRGGFCPPGLRMQGRC